MSTEITQTLTRKDFVSDQDVRWCPGCGDYAILSQVQKIFPGLDIPKEKFLIVSGIGCSSRFPYYMDTYGFHSIHGRAPAFATGAKLANPDLSVWIATGDGDSMSIGGNHFIHILRRNFDINILMFNNRIYGLTKGQYSPTSEVGKVTYATPDGSIDFPFNPPALALGAGGTFIARTIDRELKHMQAIIIAANKHSGTSFVEIYQNCNIFNDGAFSELTEKDQKAESQLVLETGQPMVFGANRDKGLILDGSQPRVVELGKKYSIDDILVHNESDKVLALMLSELTYNGNFPTPIGIIYSEEKSTYEQMLMEQISQAQSRKAGDLQTLLHDGHTWEVN